MRFYALIAMAAALLMQPGFGSSQPQSQMPPVIQQADEEYGKRTSTRLPFFIRMPWIIRRRNTAQCPRTLKTICAS